MKIYSLAIFLIASSVCLPAKAESLFEQPKKICSSLENEGLSTKGGWKESNSFPGEYICMSNMVDIGTPSTINYLATNIALYVNGKNEDRADDITIKVNINNPETQNIALDKLSRSLVTLLNTFNLSASPKIIAAIKNMEEEKVIEQFGEIEVILEPGNTGSLKVIITDKKAIDLINKKIHLSENDFENCKNTISKIVSYEISNLIGDGEPIEESGYKSFFIKGKNRDQFFCEVYPEKQYKIKAAIKGQYPFKYISEGSFIID